MEHGVMEAQQNLGLFDMVRVRVFQQYERRTDIEFCLYLRQESRKGKYYARTVKPSNEDIVWVNQRNVKERLNSDRHLHWLVRQKRIIQEMSDILLC